MKRRAFLPLLICVLGTAIYPVVAEPARQEIAAAPAPAALTQLLKAAGSKAPAVVVPATVAAIQDLGPEATSKQIAALVYAAVRTVPDSALNIVRATVKLSPEAAPDIAAAAARAVPNPWKEVRYQRGSQSPPPQKTAQSSQKPAQPVEQKEPDFKSVDSDRRKEPDFKSSPVDPSFLQPAENVLDPAAGDLMSLAEAIVLAAVDAGGNLAAVQSAVNGALFGDPGLLFSRVGGARGISGVGDAGNSNYANEPFKPGTSDRRTRLVGPNTPDPKAVSQ